MDDFLLTGHVIKSGGEDPSNNDVPAPIDSPPNKVVDKLTMEYMMNRNHYKKYLAKTDTNRFQETQEKIETLRFYEDDIVSVTHDLILDFIQHGNFTKFTSTVHNSFDKFLNDCIDYLKDKPSDDCNVDEMFPPDAPTKQHILKGSRKFRL
jgi:hypothetical protein